MDIQPLLDSLAKIISAWETAHDNTPIGVIIHIADVTGIYGDWQWNGESFDKLE